MRLMSFHLTTEQVRARTKTVTRRLGWKHAKPGDVVLAVEKARGVRVADRVTLAKIRFTEVWAEVLAPVSDDELAREGFPEWTSERFVQMFCKANGCKPDAIVTRIAFEYLEDET